MSFNLSEARLHAINTLKKTVEKLTDENKALKEQEEKWPHAYALARDWSENERLKTEIENLKEKLVEIKRHYDEGNLTDCWKMDDDYVITLPDEE